MGSAGSRPRLCQVAPCQGLEEEEGTSRPRLPRPALPRPALPHLALPSSPEQHQGHLGFRTTRLPPLRPDENKRLPSLPAVSSFQSNLPPSHNHLSSIIHSHPPLRQQALQPMAFHIGVASAANQKAWDRDHRGGGAPPCSTPRQEGPGGISRLAQVDYLEAQTALSRQMQLRRRAHQRRARERRARGRVVYTDNGETPRTTSFTARQPEQIPSNSCCVAAGVCVAVAGPEDGEGVQRLRVVSRPTERDIFWDESRGESIDLRELQLTPPPLEQDRQNPQPGPLHPQPGPHYPQPGSLHPQPGPLHPQPGPHYPQPGPLHPQPGPLHPQPGPLHPQPGSLHPHPQSPARNKDLICGGLAVSELHSPQDWTAEPGRQMEHRRPTGTSFPWTLGWNQESGASHHGSLAETEESGWNMWRGALGGRQGGGCQRRRRIWDAELE